MYSLPNEDEVQRTIVRVNSDIIDFIERELALAEALLSRREVSLKEEEFLFVNIQFGIFISGIRCLHAIRILVGHGLASDQAMTLLRTLLELTTNAITLGQGNKADNAMRYRDFVLIREWKRLKIASSYAGTRVAREDWDSFLSKFDPILQEIKERRGITEFECLRSFSTWSRRSFIDLAKDAGMENLYQLVYRTCSRVIHGTNIQQWLSGSLKEGIIVKHTASDEWASTVLLEASELFYNLVRVLNEIIGGGKQEEIEGMRESIVKLEKKYYVQNSA